MGGGHKNNAEDVLNKSIFSIVLRPRKNQDAEQGPVVQSIVSLTSSLGGQLVKCYMIFKPNTLNFFVEKMREVLHCKSFSHFFNKKYWHI